MEKVNDFERMDWGRLGSTLRYAFYVIFHPLDGFWDLVHEKRGSLGAAHVIVAALILVQILGATLTNFQFNFLNMRYFNAFTEALRVLLPLFLWTVANWSLTTLMDGKGRLPEIYMATAYALTPYVIITAALILLSQVITLQEGTVYWVLSGFSVAWSALLIMAAMMMIHDYSAGKMLFSSALSIVGMGVMIFIFLIFFSLLSDGVAYFVAVFKEIRFRLN
jgi:hypothetical protein